MGSPPKTRLGKIRAARRHGIKMPVRAYVASRKTGVPFYVTCAFLMQESSGGMNVFGSDPSIFKGAGAVTKEKYREYKRQRIASGNKKMQGVGPMQLTWHTFQDEADRMGGCWRPLTNMVVGLQIVKRFRNFSDGTWESAARRYNGSGPAADAYARQMSERFRHWNPKVGK